MIRKVNRVGRDTLTVSLPRSWTRCYGLKKGDELSIEQSGASLSITKGVCNNKASLNLDVSSLDRTGLVFTIRNYYREGIDEFKVNFSNSDVCHYRINSALPTFSVISQEVSRLIGLEITDKTESSCVLTVLNEGNNDDFEIFMRKTFHLISYSLEELAKGKEGIEEVRRNHDILTSYVSFCLRLLRKKTLLKENNINYVHTTLTLLESCMDVIQRGARIVENMEHPISEKTSMWMMDLASFFRTITKIFYTREGMENFTRKRINLDKYLSETELDKEEISLRSCLSTTLILSRGIFLG